MGRTRSVFDPQTLDRIAREIRETQELGFQICVVVGGGNICRGTKDAQLYGVHRSTADTIGMLSTIANALALSDFLEKHRVRSRVLSAFPVSTLVETYSRRKAVGCLRKDHVVVLGGGTGNPLFSTDTAAALRAIETHCCALFKGSKIDGVYDRDPEKHPDAHRYTRLDYRDVLLKELRVLDQAAVSLVRDHAIPVIVFSAYTPGAFPEVVCGRGCYTRIGANESACGPRE